MKKRTQENKRRNRMLTGVLAAAMALGLMLTGCGSSSKSAAMDSGATANGSAAAAGAAQAADLYSYYAADTAAAAEETAYEMDMDTGAGAESPQVQDTQRKLIRNVNLDVETEDFDELLENLQSKTERLGGYIEESYTYNGSSYYGRGTRNANLTIRIPAEQLNEFLSAVSDASNVISRNESITDVTLQYVDMESHKKVLEAEQERLLELMEQAENIEDIIALESRLSDVRYQIESMESQLRTLSNQVSYSTVWLSIREVEVYTPVKEQTTWEKITSGFRNSLFNVGNGFLNFGINVIIDLPYLIVWAVIIVLIVLIVRLFVKRRIRKLQKRREAAYQAGAPNTVSGQQEAQLQNKEQK